MSIIPTGTGQGMSTVLSNMIENFWNKSSNDNALSSYWQLLSEQQTEKVTLGLEKVGDRLVTDLAQITADYLIENPDLEDNYVLVIVDDPTQGRIARAYNPEDLVTDLEGEEKEEAIKRLIEQGLVYHDRLDELPEVDESDEELLGLAESAQAFLDQNEKLLNLLEKNEVLPWS
jgi:hypothetical protein